MPQRRHVLTVLTGLGLGALAGCTEAAPEAPPSAPAPTPSPTATPTPSPSPSRPPSSPARATDPLTGGKMSRNGVFAVKIDNVAAARPQIGIGRADIVVVEQVEAGLTRLVGVFHSTFPGAVGPVRSARNTDVELLPLFGRPGLVYSGANRLVQARVQGSSHLVAIERNDRVPGRPAPHNVVVDLAALARQHTVGAVRSIGWRFAATDRRWDRAEKIGTFTERIGGDTFSFSRDKDRYRIAVNGDRYTDAADGRPVLADTVVVLSVRNRRDTDTTSRLSIVSETTGAGRVTVTRQGRRVSGTWRRKDLTSPMTLTDDDGKPITLRPGRTWLLLRGS